MLPIRAFLPLERLVVSYSLVQLAYCLTQEVVPALVERVEPPLCVARGCLRVGLSLNPPEERRQRPSSLLRATPSDI